MCGIIFTVTKTLPASQLVNHQSKVHLNPSDVVMRIHMSDLIFPYGLNDFPLLLVSITINFDFQFDRIP